MPTADLDTLLPSITFRSVFDILHPRFVKCTDVADGLAIALRTRQNVILWGPGGHGKSEMVRDALRGLGLEKHAMILAFGSGTREETLWGGMNFKRLDAEKVLDYDFERSFANVPIAVFEEVFDAPDNVITDLKDSLSRGTVCKGPEPFPLRTRVIICCTNRDPKQFNTDASRDGLLQRFPLQWKVVWDQYSAQDYEELFLKRGMGTPEECRLVAQEIACANSAETIISPRIAIKAFLLARDAAGRERITPQCFAPWRFLPDLAGAVAAKNSPVPPDAAPRSAAPPPPGSPKTFPEVERQAEQFVEAIEERVAGWKGKRRRMESRMESMDLNFQIREAMLELRRLPTAAADSRRRDELVQRLAITLNTLVEKSGVRPEPDHGQWFDETDGAGVLPHIPFNIVRSIVCDE